jgi:phosphoribosylaminoimidazole-succinocarboxamide synthase
MKNEQEVLLKTEIPVLGECKRGKVRDLYDLGEHLLLVATDRVSAFDVVLPNGIPEKGKILTQLSVFWFDLLKVPNHLVTADVAEMPAKLHPFRDQLEGRSMLVKKVKIFPIECVVRGYLAGSGWGEYQRGRSVCGVPLPEGLLESSKIDEPIFTPSTKEEEGHDENIPFEEMVRIIGEPRARELRERSLEVYRRAAEYALTRGILLADTKFEWGMVSEDEPALLSDEVLTPDSSRFWDHEIYAPGKGQPAFDKQYVRDYLLTQDWDRTPPGPQLPPEVVAETTQRYAEIFERLTGKSWSAHQASSFENEASS